MRIKAIPQPSLAPNVSDEDCLVRAGYIPSISLAKLRYRTVHEPPRRDRRTRLPSVTVSDADDGLPKMVTRGVSALSTDPNAGIPDRDDMSSVASGFTATDADQAHRRAGRGRRNSRKENAEDGDGDVLLDMLADNQSRKRDTSSSPWQRSKSSRNGDSTSLLSHPLAGHPNFPTLTKMQETVTQAILDHVEQPCAFEDVCAYVARVRNVRRRDSTVQRETEDVLTESITLNDGTPFKLFREDVIDPGMWFLNPDSELLKEVPKDVKTPAPIAEEVAKPKEQPILPKPEIQPIPLTSIVAQRILGSDFTDLQVLIVDTMHNNGGKCDFEVLFEAVSAQWGRLKRRNGQKYTSDPRKSLLACLGKPMFARVDTDNEEEVWSLAPYVTELALAADGRNGILPATTIPVAAVDAFQKESSDPFTDIQADIIRIVVSTPNASISYRDLLDSINDMRQSDEAQRKENRKALNSALGAGVKNITGSADKPDSSLFIKVDPALRMEGAMYILSERARSLLTPYVREKKMPVPEPAPPDLTMHLNTGSLAKVMAVERAKQNKHLDLQAYLAVLLRLVGGIAPFSHLLEESLKVWTHIRKKDGSRYTSDPRKAVQSALTGNTCPVTVFRRHPVRTPIYSIPDLFYTPHPAQTKPEHWLLLVDAARSVGMLDFEHDEEEVMVDIEELNELQSILVKAMLDNETVERELLATIVPSASFTSEEIDQTLADPALFKSVDETKYALVNREEAAVLSSKYDDKQLPVDFVKKRKAGSGGRWKGKRRRRI